MSTALYGASLLLAVVLIAAAIPWALVGWATWRAGRRRRADRGQS